MLSRLLILLYLCTAGISSYFDEHTRFNLEWAGKANEIPVKTSNDDKLLIASSNNENYVCYLPRAKDESEAMDLRTSFLPPPNEIDLLRPLFDKDICINKVTSYWTYELCHGKQLRQYHKEEGIFKVTGSKIISDPAPTISFILGKFPEPDWRNQKALKEKYKQKEYPPKYRFARIELPYYAVDLEGGEMCDLTGQPRTVRVFYFCQTETKAEFYDIQEISTCNYEVLVFTSYLCDHKKYRVDPSEQELNIKCYAGDESSPVKPSDLSKFIPSPPRYKDIFGKKRNSKGNKGDSKDDSDDDEDSDDYVDDFLILDQLSLGPVPSLDSDDPFSKFGRKEMISKAKKSLGGGKQGYQIKPPPAPAKPLPTNYQPIKDFLRGSYCLHGGMPGGWWRYELCFGRYAMQYHDDISDNRHSMKRTEISLGKWKSEKHLKWLEDHPNKRPKKPIERRRSVSYLYSDGDVCDATGLQRYSVVKLTCDPSDSSEAIGISLSEPSTCVYEIDVIAGQWLCTIIRSADEDGIFDLESIIQSFTDETPEKDSTTSDTQTSQTQTGSREEAVDAAPESSTTEKTASPVKPDDVTPNVIAEKVPQSLSPTSAEKTVPKESTADPVKISSNVIAEKKSEIDVTASVEKAIPRESTKESERVSSDVIGNKEPEIHSTEKVVPKESTVEPEKVSSNVGTKETIQKGLDVNRVEDDVNKKSAQKLQKSVIPPSTEDEHDSMVNDEVPESHFKSQSKKAAEVSVPEAHSNVGDVTQSKSKSPKSNLDRQEL